MSRYSSGLHVAFPLVPPAPTATIDASKITAPAITIVLPTLQQDLWGVEIRDSDNLTVLYHSDLSNAAFVPIYTRLGNTTRNLSYFVYTYNLLGELSAAYNATATIPTPAISALVVDEDTKLLNATATNATLFKVEIDKVSTAFANLSVNTTNKNASWHLSDLDFFFQRFFRVTPGDDLGFGTAVQANHVYTPTGVVQLTSSEAQSVAPPASPTTDATVPSPYAPYAADYVAASWEHYNDNLAQV
jgi:hypothetical protein